MIEHVSVSVSNYNKSVKFYSSALKSLGYKLYRKYPPMAGGYLEGGSTSFWIVKQKGKVQPMHVALGSKSKKGVNDFHKQALKAGGKDNGKPGFRLAYGNTYYAAFVLDPDGNNIEACYFGAEAPKLLTKKK
jgi:predicted lactoylglutathione lyase